MHQNIPLHGHFSSRSHLEHLKDFHEYTWELEAWHQVSKQFPDGTYSLFRNIDWSGAQPGETMALIGESGSGKTTLLRLLNRLIEPSSGDQYFIQGQTRKEPRPHQPSSETWLRPSRWRSVSTLDG